MSADASETIRPEIESVLGRLRSKIRTYVFLEGTAWVLVVLGALFWITLGLNWAYFKVSNLELPVWFRLLIDIGAIGFVVVCLMLLVVQRLLKSMRTRALALVLEHRFPELDDRLITAVEAADSATGNETPFTNTLLKRTITDVTEATKRLEVSDVFAKRPLVNAMLIAVVFVASILGFGFLNKKAMAYWYQAYFGLQEEYWDRETLLKPQVIASSDGRVKEFTEVDGQLIYKHPRGEDFTLSVIVPETERTTGGPWIIPEEVEWDYEFENDRGGATKLMRKTDDREFRQTISGLLDGMAFTIRGNDYINRKTLQVIVVDPPAIETMQLECDYPDYTNLNPEFLPERGTLPSNIKTILSSQITEPMETEMVLRANTNKPLTGLVIEGPTFKLVANAATTDKDGKRVPATVKLERLRDDGVPDVEMPLAEGVADLILPGVNEVQQFDLSAAGGTVTLSILDPETEETAEVTFSSKDDFTAMQRSFDDATSALGVGGVCNLKKTDSKTVFQAEFAGSWTGHDLAPMTVSVGTVSVKTLKDGGSDFASAFALPVKLATDASKQFELGDQSAPLSAIPLASNTLLRIYLRDTDDILNSEPSRLTINGITDKPPELEVEYFGIGEYITKRAQIPVRGIISDDYGLADARFEYQVMSKDGKLLSGADWIPVEFEPAPDYVKSYPLFRDNGTTNITDDDEDFARFDVTKILFQDENGPRGIQVGDTLTLTVYAQDGDTINGPHEVREKPAPEFVFKVVSEDELLAILYQRELDQLNRFQQIIEEVGGVEAAAAPTGVKADLIQAQADARELMDLSAKDSLTEEEQARKNQLASSVKATATRSILQIAKNQGETRAVEAKWQEILDELGNNGINNAKFSEQLRIAIIDPLKRIGDQHFPDLDDALEAYQRAYAGGENPDETIAESLMQMETLLTKMREVYKEMDDLCGFQAMRASLQSIIKGTEEAKTEANKEALEQLEKLNNLLD